MIGNADFFQKAFRISITMFIDRFLMKRIKTWLAVFRIGFAHENSLGWNRSITFIQLFSSICNLRMPRGILNE